MRVATIAACLLLSAGAGLAADARGRAPPSRRRIRRAASSAGSPAPGSAPTPAVPPGRPRTPPGRGASTALDQACGSGRSFSEWQALQRRQRAAAHVGAPGAVELLEPAARDASLALAPRAWYNLGNAHLAGGDPRGAIAAYRESLLRDPGQTDAKHNLELALRRLEQQQKQEEQEQQQKQQQKRQQQEGGRKRRRAGTPADPAEPDDRDERAGEPAAAEWRAPAAVP